MRGRSEGARGRGSEGAGERGNGEAGRKEEETKKKKEMMNNDRYQHLLDQPHPPAHDSFHCGTTKLRPFQKQRTS